MCQFLSSKSCLQQRQSTIPTTPAWHLCYFWAPWLVVLFTWKGSQIKLKQTVLYCTVIRNSLRSSLPAGYKTPRGLKWGGTRCVLCASSMVTACQCVEYQFSPVARHGQRLKLRNIFYWLVTGIVGDDSYCSHQDTTLNHTCWHSQVNTTWCHSD